MANPPTKDLPDVAVTVLDDDVYLHIEASDFFEPPVCVTFLAFYDDSTGGRRKHTWSEDLIAEHSTLRNPPQGKYASRIHWTVNVGNNLEMTRQSVRLVFSVLGRAESTGHDLHATSQDRILIGVLQVTNLPQMTRIMLHEFAMYDGSAYVFDPSPLQSYLATLTVQQKKTLFHHGLRKPSGRLVIFITLYPKNGLKMYADYCKRAGCVRPNATFSVFHCRDPFQNDITLVCHTQYFLLNLRNYFPDRPNFRDTWRWLHKIQHGKKPDQWLDKRNPRPIQYKVATMKPGDDNDGVLWNRIFTPSGRDIMHGNTMHGIINTIGCWMLFRNYNWPVSERDAFDVIYRKTLRSGEGWNTVSHAIAGHGYDQYVDENPPGFTSSLIKWFCCDVNFAYLFFFHDVVGIKYFSSGINFFNCDKTEETDVGRPTVNDYQPHGLVLEKVFRKSNLPAQGACCAYDTVQWDRDKTVGAVQGIGDNLWQVNALGFQTASGFIPESQGRFGDEAQIDACSWADVYFYKEDSVQVKDLKCSNYSEPGD